MIIKWKRTVHIFIQGINYPLITSEIISFSTGHWHFKSDLKSLFPVHVACLCLHLSSPLCLHLSSLPLFSDGIRFLCWGHLAYLCLASLATIGMLVWAEFFCFWFLISFAIVFFPKELVKVHRNLMQEIHDSIVNKNDQNLYQVFINYKER